MSLTEIRIKSKSFCITGKLSEFQKVADAENEIKDRGGYVLQKVTSQLDYLIVGSIPSPDWKHGSYGTKIETALKLNSKSRKPQIIHEIDFVNSLMVIDRDDIKREGQKVALIRVQFILSSSDTTLKIIEDLIIEIKKDENFHHTKKIYDISSYSFLSTSQDGHLKVEYRILKHLYADQTGTGILNILKEKISQLPDVDPKILYSEKYEGTSEFLRLLQEIPNNLKMK
jgi:hypothetical protein